MKEIDPKRSRRLRRRAYVSYGPNFCWHIDGRCKLGDKSHYPSSDCGTENVVLATMQCYFRNVGNDEFAAEKGHQYGSSPSNQRTEG